MSGTAPVFTSSADVIISENTLLATTVTATDTELDTLKYSIVGGTDKGLFTIDATTGALSFKSAPDFEAPTDGNGDNIYEVTVKVYDGSNSVTQAITVTVDNVGGVLLLGDAGGPTDDTLGQFDATGEEDVVAGFDGNDTLYGLGGNDSLYGGIGNDRLDGGTGADDMHGGAGDDTYVVDNAGDIVDETDDLGADAGGNDTVQASVSYALTAHVENLVLTGTGLVDGTGNDLDNQITGTSRRNTIDGGAGADIMIGGDGDDTYYVDDAGDSVVEVQNNGVDTVHATVDYNLADFVDNLILDGTALSGTGNNLANNLTGNAENNVLSGLDGADTLNGGDGIDTLAGGAGNDVYVVDSDTDIIVEAANEGTDTVQSSVDYDVVLADNVENITLTGTAIIARGNLGANVMRGNAGDNVMRGLAGNDIMIGGAGADWMSGGSGDDKYYVDNVGDTAVELAGLGNDTVISTLTWDLGIGSNVENLTLDGTAKIDGTGNELNNILVGNSNANKLMGLDGNDRLDGGGGADTMIGGTGNDVYIVNAAGDTVTELVGEGTDTVQSSVSYTLGDNVERLLLTGLAVTNGTGNDLDNYLRGNVQNNVLTGGLGNDTINGAGGADTMIGGQGDDIYYVNSLLDVVTENAGEGTDLVYLSKSGYTLAAAVENLTLLGKTNMNAHGNGLANTIIGNVANNVLDGGGGNDIINGGNGNDTLIGGSGNDRINGGAGADVINAGFGADDLWGGAGNDKFIVSSLAEGGTDDTTNDWIYDFAQGDKIDVSAIDAISGTATNDAFVLDADGIYTAGEIQVATAGLDVMLSFHVDGDGIADMTIRLKNVAVDTIDASDFIF